MLNSLKKKFFISSLVLVSLGVLAACDKKHDQTGGLPQATYTELKAQAVPLVTEHSGKATAVLVAEVRPQVGGIILKQLFEEGSFVEEGAMLYQIDPALFQAAVDTAKANLARAEANATAARLLAQRYAELVKVKAVSRQEYDNAAAASSQARAEVAAAKASLDTAKINLVYTRVLAPISGVIGKSSVTPGALVAPGQATPLAMIQKRDFMYVDIPRSGTDLLRMRKAEQANSLRRSPVSGAKVTLILPDGTDYSEPGELMFADITVDAGTGSYITRALFPNPHGVLMQNLFVRVRIEEAVSESAILLPQRLATSNPQGETFVRVLVPFKETEEKKAPKVDDPKLAAFEVENRIVKLGRAVDNQWVVTSGLNAGDKVAVDGVTRLRPGQTTVLGRQVELTSAAAAAKPATGAQQ